MKHYTYKSKKLPKNNGRAQLWVWKGQQSERLRMIYANGMVEYYSTFVSEGYWKEGCTSGNTQKEAVKNCLRYSQGWSGKNYFLGYL